MFNGFGELLAVHCYKLLIYRAVGVVGFGVPESANSVERSFSASCSLKSVAVNVLASCFAVLCLYEKNYLFVCVTVGCTAYPGMVLLIKIFHFTCPKFHLLSISFSQRVSCCFVGVRFAEHDFNQF